MKIIAISTAHSASQLQALGFSYPMIPGSPSGSSINNTYQIDAYPTVIVIAPNKTIVEKDIWPIDNTILRSKILNAGGVPTTCPSADIEEEKISRITMYPNPVSDVLNISYDREFRAEITDILGKQVEVFSVNKQISYDCSNLQPGIYLLRAFDSKGQLISVHKFFRE